MRIAAVILACSSAAQAAADYSREIKPLLQQQCVKCHGASTQKSSLRLDTASAALKGGESGTAIVPGNSGESLLVRTIEGAHGDIPRMPYKRPPLDSAQIALIRRWIDEGAKAPADEQPSDDRHWAFIKPVKAPRNLAKRNPIDVFIEERLAKAGIAPLPKASPETLARRLSLDLTGLPPRAEFLAASHRSHQSPSTYPSYEKLTDSLMKSPAFGERWGRWWLDQARYADSDGYSIDAPRQIWRYRDWVIDALNKDMPFDQFTIEQLAGDLLDKPAAEQVIATGFHRNTQVNREGGIDPEQFRVESVVDRVNTTGAVWLGLTIGCCQCHDHKFDPISQKEYYQLYAFFNHTEPDGHGGGTGPQIAVPDAKVDYELLNEEKKSLEQEMRDALKRNGQALKEWEADLPEEKREKLAADVKKALAVRAEKRSLLQQRVLLYASEVNNDQEFRHAHNRLIEIEKGLAARPMTMVMKEMPKKRETRLFIKGDFTRPDAAVAEGVPAVLHDLGGQASTWNRLDLARWLVSRENPLTARVIVNRVWQQLFGRGLVETENDFGTMGSPPSHPELLDWLAVEFMDRGWSLKELLRIITASDAYQRSSSIDASQELVRKARAADPNNYLLWRQSRLRLDAEAVRDVSLAISGLLSEKRGGPGVYPPIPDGVMSLGQVKRPWPLSKGEDRYRRGIYTFVFRATPPPSLAVFDAPDGFSTCTRRIRSNTPLQALTLLNDAAFHEFATALSRIIEKDGLAAAFRRCTSRQPAADELALLGKLSPLAAARTLLNLDETITRE